MKKFIARSRTFLLIIVTFLCVPFVYIGILLRSMRKVDGARLNILVIPQLTRIGDLVCSTPVFRAIKENYPNAHLTVLVSKKVVGIIEYNPRIDDILVYEDYSFWGLVKKIYIRRYDWSFSLVGVSTLSLVTFLGMVKNRVKTTRLNRPKSEVITDWMNNFRLVYHNHTHLPSHYLKLLQYLGIQNANIAEEVFVTDAGEQKVRQFFIEYKISDPDVLVGIAITAGNKIKEWGDANFIQLARLIHERYQVKVIFFGSATDRLRIEALLEGMDKDKNIPATYFSINELPSLVNKLSLFIAVDTGLVYVAHGLGVPLVDIVGPVDPNEQPPLDEQSLQVLPLSNIGPSSFVFKAPGSQELNRRAIESITVTRVFGAVENLLRQ